MSAHMASAGFSLGLQPMDAGSRSAGNARTNSNPCAASMFTAIAPSAVERPSSRAEADALIQSPNPRPKAHDAEPSRGSGPLSRPDIRPGLDRTEAALLLLSARPVSPRAQNVVDPQERTERQTSVM